MVDQTLFLLSVGPVQSFIASARKTEDLWGGSYILSYLVEQAIGQLEAAVAELGSSVELIFPAASQVETAIEVASFPNRLLVMVNLPAEVASALGEEIAEFIREQFVEISSFAIDDAFAGSAVDRKYMKEMAKEQVLELLEITWAVEPLGDNYELARKRLESRLAAIKNNRDYGANLQDGLVCTVCGEWEALHAEPYPPMAKVGLMKKQLRQTWDNLQAKYRPKDESDEEDNQPGRIRRNEHLCGICLSKRTLRDYFRVIKSRNIKGFRSTLKIAGEQSNYYAIIVMDGDDMGQWLSGNKGQFPEPAGSIEYHRIISKRLNRFAGQQVPKLVAEAGGDLVYAGGDDVLAFVPLKNALDLCNKLRTAFSNPDYGLHSEATASIGMTVIHEKHPLSSALRNARRMEQKAKNYINPYTKVQKDAIGIAVYSRSGEQRETVFPWIVDGENMIAIMQNLEQLLKDDISTTFLHRFGEAFLPLVGAHKKSAKIRLFDGRDQQEELLALELTRLLERSVLDEAANNEKIKSFIPEMARDMAKVHEIMTSSLQFVHWLETVDFMRRKLKEGRKNA